MGSPKKNPTVAPDEIELEVPEESAPLAEHAEVEPIVGPVAPGAPPIARKSLGVKEPIVFKWKIVGRSGGTVVTLFKSVEREEVEAQLERLTRDGYYTNLQILEATAKVDQPPAPREAKKPAKARETKTAEREPAKAKVQKARGTAKTRPAKKAAGKGLEKPARSHKSKTPKASSKKTAKRK